MTETKKQRDESVIESSTLLDCPDCPNQGWYVDADRLTGEPVQVQCEFCWTNQRSKFNGRSNRGIDGKSPSMK